MCIQKSKDQIIILTPRLKEQGGVANYYSILRPHLSASNIQYFQVGHDSSLSNLGNIILFAYNYVSFLYTILAKPINLVHINPSLGYKSIIRDGVFSILSSICRKKKIIFFRGWDKTVELKISQSKILRFVFNKAYFTSDMIVVLASDFSETLRSWGYQGKIVLETTVVDDSILKLNLPKYNQRSNNLLFLSRIEKNKGIFETLSATEALLKTHPKLTLTVAGDGPDFIEVKAKISQMHSERIKLTGYIRGTEKSNVLLYSGVYLLPTYYGEGMPNALLEAMAFGMPVITHPAGGIADFFENQKMGVLIDKPTSKNIIAAINQLQHDPELSEKMGHYNRKYILKKCTASNVAQRLKNLYSIVLA